MTEPPTTKELCETGGFAAHQARDVLHQLTALGRLVELTGLELPDAIRRELETDLRESILALYALQLSVCEARRSAGADQQRPVSPGGVSSARLHPPGPFHLS